MSATDKVIRVTVERKEKGLSWVRGEAFLGYGLQMVRATAMALANVARGPSAAFSPESKSTLD